MPSNSTPGEAVPELLPPTETWIIQKPAVEGEKGLVASQHHLASDIGARVLSGGGNAVDAAIAASFAIGTLEPWMSGLGGGGYMLIYSAEHDETVAVEFGMVAPNKLDPADYPLTGEPGADMFGWPAVLYDRNVHGPLAIAVPGQVAGMALAHAEYGTLSWRDLLVPAIELAERGLLADWFVSLAITASARDLARYPASAQVYLPDGMPPAGAWSGPPPRIALTNLADTLRRLADFGARDFYEGDISRTIVGDLSASGAKLGAQDLANYRARISKVAISPYRNAAVHVAPGLTAGPSLAAALSSLSAHELQRPGPDQQAYVAYASSLQNAYRRRFSDLGDASNGDTPECTSHISVVDGAGNFVALTQTLLSPFGSKVVLPKSGILMNNGIMWFDPRPGHPNSIGPGKRPLSNMCPTVVRHGDGRLTALGASGGRRIMPAVFQLISFFVDHGMTMDEAFSQARIDVSGVDLATVDARLPAEIARQLAENMLVERRIHGVYPAMFACPNAVSRDPQSGRMSGAAYVMSPWAKVSAAS